MMQKITSFFILFLGLFFLSNFGFAKEPDQEILQFNLAGFQENGKKNWELNSQTANIFQDTVKLSNIIAKSYANKEAMTLVADEGTYDKTKSAMHLEKNVKAVSSSGATLNTNSLDWDQNTQLITTKDDVSIQKDNITAEAKGAEGQPDLKKASLLEGVKVEINQEDQNKNKQRIIITCDGPLEIDYEKQFAVFKQNVKVDDGQSQMYSDEMEVYFAMGDKKEESSKEGSMVGSMNRTIDRILAKGNVRIVRGENSSFSDRAIYLAPERRILLVGSPRLVLYSTTDSPQEKKDNDASSGN